MLPSKEPSKLSRLDPLSRKTASGATLATRNLGLKLVLVCPCLGIFRWLVYWLCRRQYVDIREYHNGIDSHNSEGLDVSFFGTLKLPSIIAGRFRMETQ